MGTILVTGGAGYIGSHTCKALARAGHTPVTFDNLSRGFEHAVKWGPFERGDILDAERLGEAIARHRPDAVVHFAAFAYVGESMLDPGLYFRNNVVGTLGLLDAMRAHGVNRIVFSSSCTTYGARTSEPITEARPQAPVDPYGRSKWMVEQILRDYAAAYGLNAVALRYFNAAGADPDGEIGEDHDPETHLIPVLLDAAVKGAPFMINGDDYDTVDGTCVRDYVHVSDLAEAHVLALRALERDPGFVAYNLGTGRGFSIREIIDAASRRLGRTVEVSVGPRRPGDLDATTAVAALAERELGWTPRLSNMDDIIDTAWRWRLRRLNRAAQGVEPVS
ncbi:MAG TPA: UDP-glucose 4-epimerase GalE [Caulobacteraceae bacterium]|jgi:UDP-arabinose 4-epimerase|nr:UDP-glucose 4-epimerase GalE [Caulobacteraceae bacterium]